MSTELTYDEIMELLPAYVLGALEPDEMSAVDAQVQNNPILQQRVSALEQAAVQLAHLAPNAPLPTDARERLLTRVRDDLTQDIASAAAPTVAAPTAPRQQSRRFFEGWFSGLNRWLVFGGAFAALVIGLYVGQTQGQLNELSQQLSAMRETVVTLDQRAQESEQVLALLSDRSVRLSGATATVASADASLYVQGESGVLVVRGLEPLPTSQTYQLWLLVDGTPMPAELIDVRPDEPVILTVSIPPDAQGFGGAAISVEPAGGSRQVTENAIVLQGDVT
jgi:anti-sigma-K factor RskA